MRFMHFFNTQIPILCTSIKLCRNNDTHQVDYITICEKSSVVLEHIEVAVEGELTFGEVVEFLVVGEAGAVGAVHEIHKRVGGYDASCKTRRDSKNDFARFVVVIETACDEIAIRHASGDCAVNALVLWKDYRIASDDSYKLSFNVRDDGNHDGQIVRFNLERDSHILVGFLKFEILTFQSRDNHIVYVFCKSRFFHNSPSAQKRGDFFDGRVTVCDGLQFVVVAVNGFEHSRGEISQGLLVD